jgi:hypothetical protein
MSSSPSTRANATLTSALADSDLLDDGATMWFSVVINKSNDGGANEHGGFALGTAPVRAAFNGERMSGYGVGFELENTIITPGTWDGDADNETGISKGSSIGIGDLPATIFVVGQIEWGATAGDEETITIYTPPLTNLTNLGEGQSATVGGFDQSALNILSMTQRNSGGTHTYDEIRFGASLEDVTSGGPVQGPLDLKLTIAESSLTAGSFDFTWPSQEGLLYDLVSSTDLSTAPETWAVWEGKSGLTATPPLNTLTGVSGGGSAKRFFAIVPRSAN